jgi:transcriptional regulator with XRE-family HTH domain
MSEEPHPIDLEVGKIIRQQRLNKGISQAELGGRIGKTFPQIQKYERGINRVSASTLVEIARALDTEIAFFFKSSQEQGNAPLQESPSEDVMLPAVRQSVLLHTAFVSIKDDYLRTKVLGLVQAIARNDLPTAEENVPFALDGDH